MEHPGVIGASNGLTGIAGPGRAKLRTTMRTAVIEHVNLTVMIPGHDQGLPANSREIIVAWLGDLAFMSHIDPGSLKDALHLEVENFGVGIGFPMRPILLDQPGNFMSRPRHDICSLCSDASISHGGQFSSISRSTRLPCVSPSPADDTLVTLLTAPVAAVRIFQHRRQKRFAGSVH